MVLRFCSLWVFFRCPNSASTESTASWSPMCFGLLKGSVNDRTTSANQLSRSICFLSVQDVPIPRSNVVSIRKYFLPNALVGNFECFASDCFFFFLPIGTVLPVAVRTLANPPTERISVGIVGPVGKHATQSQYRVEACFFDRFFLPHRGLCGTTPRIWYPSDMVR